MKKGEAAEVLDRSGYQSCDAFVPHPVKRAASAQAGHLPFEVATDSSDPMHCTWPGARYAYAWLTGKDQSRERWISLPDGRIEQIPGTVNGHRAVLIVMVERSAER